MREFLQYFVLAVCAFGFGYLVLLNNAKLAPSTRIILGVIFTVVAFFAAWTMQRISAPTTEVSSHTSPPLHQPSGTPVTNPANAEPQGLSQPKGQSASEPPAPSKSEEPSSLSAEEASAVTESREFSRVEVLYDGPTAAGGVVNPKDMMAKELSDAGFQVLMPDGPASEGTGPEPARTAPASRPPAATPQAARQSAPAEPSVPRSPSGLTVKEVFDFVRKAQQGKLSEEPERLGAFQFLSTTLLAATPPAAGVVVVAMRASMRRLREYQGIFSTEAQMDIVAVTADGKRIQRVVTMEGPESARGFGLDWEQAEEKALREISSQMCPAFAKKLRERVGQKK